nr:hypothetical protein [Tanacetum cinerariifolium]
MRQSLPKSLMNNLFLERNFIVNMLKHIFRGRLLARFQDHEHEGGVTRSQGEIKDIVLKIKIQDHSMQKKFPRTRLQVSRKKTRETHSQSPTQSHNSNRRLERWDKKSFKDKLPHSIYENPQYQRLSRHPINVQTFPDPIIFLAGLNPSWEHEMAFRNFMYAKDDEDSSLLPREPSPSLDATNPEQLVENTADSRGSPACEGMLVIGAVTVTD